MYAGFFSLNSQKGEHTEWVNTGQWMTDNLWLVHECITRSWFRKTMSPKNTLPVYAAICAEKAKKWRENSKFGWSGGGRDGDNKLEDRALHQSEVNFSWAAGSPIKYAFCQIQRISPHGPPAFSVLCARWKNSPVFKHSPGSVNGKQTERLIRATNPGYQIPTF